MKLIIGLGNPGNIYTHNRHNIGFACLRHFARRQGIRLNKSQARARTGTGEVSGQPVVLARPQTFMNLSGQSVSRLVNRYSLTPKDLIVIHDDLDLPLGKLRIRQGGGAGGHKGMDSIITELKASDFIRMRVGIGRPVADAPNDEATIRDYVLGDYTSEERAVINRTIRLVNDALLTIIIEDVTVAMNRYN